MTLSPITKRSFCNTSYLAYANTLENRQCVKVFGVADTEMIQTLVILANCKPQLMIYLAFSPGQTHQAVDIMQGVQNPVTVKGREEVLDIQFPQPGPPPPLGWIPRGYRVCKV